MAIPQPSARPTIPSQNACPAPERAAPADLQTILAEQLEVTHRVAMSGMANIADWSEALPQMSPAGKENYSGMISRLGQSLTRMMAETRRCVTTLDRLQRADAQAAPREDG